MELIKKIHRTWFVLFIMIFFLIKIKQERLYNKKKDGVSMITQCPITAHTSFEYRFDTFIICFKWSILT